jgi:hypothetical protein
MNNQSSLCFPSVFCNCGASNLKYIYPTVINAFTFKFTANLITAGEVLCLQVG